MQTVLNDGGEPEMFSQLPTQKAGGGGLGSLHKKLPVKKNGKGKTSVSLL